MCAGPNNADRPAYIDEDKKLITSDGRPLGLYDLKADAEEKKDLLDDAELKEKVMGRYKAFVKELKHVKVQGEPKSSARRSALRWHWSRSHLSLLRSRDPRSTTSTI